MSSALSPAAIMLRHPCFNESAHERIGRIHLPVAPHCNIHCRFCERRVCANLSVQHPGWARRLLSPSGALDLVRRQAAEHLQSTTSIAKAPFVVGVAGPGEPLANEATFEALGLVHREFPQLQKCVSTNGLLLAERLPQLLSVGVTALTVTVNAPEGQVGQHIYAWVRHRGRTYRGQAGADLLIGKQMEGIQAALDARLALKVNTVLIPGVNDRATVRLAQRLERLGVRLMNVMPLIPGGEMSDRRAPTCEELGQVRLDCEQHVPQFRRCQQCSADVICFPLHRPQGERV